MAVLTAEEGALVLQPMVPVLPAPGPQPWQPGLRALKEGSERGLMWPGLPLALALGRPPGTHVCARKPARTVRWPGGPPLPSLQSVAAQGSATNHHMRGGAPGEAREEVPTTPIPATPLPHLGAGGAS